MNKQQKQAEKRTKTETDQIAGTKNKRKKAKELAV